MLEILDWTHFSTAAGVATVVMALTQVVKRYVTQVDPKWAALCISLFVHFMHLFVIGAVSPGAMALALLNAIMTAGVAIGEYEGILKPIKDMISKGKDEAYVHPRD